MVQAVLTHPGGAHKDDLLAVCVLIARYNVPVYRREPNAEELKDPRVAVVDVGGCHDPKRHNFDHHHFPRDYPPTCALSLVLAHLGLYEDALKFCDWLEPAEWFDSRGPDKTAAWLNVPRRAISQLNSPVDITLLRRFAQSTELRPGDTLYEFMRMVGTDLLDYLEGVRERIRIIAEHVEHWTVTRDSEELSAVFLPRLDEVTSEPSAAVAGYVRAELPEASVAALVYPDRRGSGYGIARHDDHPSLDFSRVQHEPDVHFAHKSGFMCKTSSIDPIRLREIIALAWLD